ncbi:MAG: radical SAM protein, partial [Clostridia bacterium]|nr:radical SAM protein [Clostridia bacterium]
MHYTLHLTTACNMACKYCYVAQQPCVMPASVAKAAVDAAERAGGSAGIIFFGGEPLLQKELIYETIDYAKWLEQHGRVRFHFKVTTNGLLLDESFLRFSADKNVFIALSHDGTQAAHDHNRIDHAGQGTFSRLSPVIDALLEAR